MDDDAEVRRLIDLVYDHAYEEDAEKCRAISDRINAVVESLNSRLRASAAPDAAGREDTAPGEWTCDKCGFGLSTRTLHVPSGAVSVRAVVETEICPNDGTPLRSLTWREIALSQRDRIVELGEELIAARASSASSGGTREPGA